MEFFAIDGFVEESSTNTCDVVCIKLSPHCFGQYETKLYYVTCVRCSTTCMFGV